MTTDEKAAEFLWARACAYVEFFGGGKLNADFIASVAAEAPEKYARMHDHLVAAYKRQGPPIEAGTPADVLIHYAFEWMYKKHAGAGKSAAEVYAEVLRVIEAEATK